MSLNTTAQKKKKSKIKAVFVEYCLHILGFFLCTLPPAICTISFFPVWREAGGGRALSGVCAFFMILCAIPLFKAIRIFLQSAASYTVWIILFILCFLFSRISNEATVISFVGSVSNILGALCFWIARRVGRGAKHNEE